MNLKIYNGYHLPEMSMSELATFLEGFKVKILKISKDLYAKEMARLMTTMVDSLMLYPEEEFLERIAHGSVKPVMSDTPYNSTLYIANNRFYDIKKLNIKDPEYDFYCDLEIRPKSGGGMLCRFFSKKELYINEWESLPGVESYYYDDECERPNEISEQDWINRKIDWESNTTALNFSCVFHPPYFDDDINERIGSFIPSYEDRLVQLSEGILFREKMKSLSHSSDSPYEHYTLTIEWMGKSNEAKKRLKEIMNSVRKVIVKDLSLELFINTFDTIKKEAI